MIGWLTAFLSKYKNRLIDSDGYGNACDGDLNNNGFTNAQDTTLFRKLLSLPPGPSGLSCAGTIGCPAFVVIGNSSGFLRRQDACGNTLGRSCESIAGNAVSDALRETYQVDFAFANSGGIRADLTCPATDSPTDSCPPYTPPLPFTRGQVFTALPLGNKAVTVTITGAVLKAMLENDVSSMPLALA